MQDEEQKQERVLVEDEDHPELTRVIQWRERRDRRSMRFTKRDHKMRRLADKLNQPQFTNRILGYNIILGLLFLAFGFLEALTLVGHTINNIWSIYSATSIFGWKGHAITGFALIIIGIIMLWSVPYYFRNKIQQGDSYLIIGSGIGLLFGIIYILIILADVLKGIVIGLANATPIIIETYLYPAILLAILAIPIFRLIAIRHVIGPSAEEDDEDEEENEEELE
ncbi:MAG: hypothetical protein ACTSO7_04580 [Candidatus Heimdallarchaeota archaeon]